eukprot:CAMPEP_0171472018 /NCGR_PEP_ID=MMETSP0946-20130122/1040_1 /TAXON_ID=109269 /ORGANISM="Vaucheria litorea, Strain CCMP2940" /LENGTH=673 /DNA_ID=CAMNT_0012001599 /DNA_START=79 /DNA_END=2101 /DNA_ORIENTATION=-
MSSSPSISPRSRTSALEEFEKKQEKLRIKKEAEAKRLLEEKEKDVFSKAERARLVIERAEKLKIEEKEKKRLELEKLREQRLAAQTLSMKKFEERRNYVDTDKEKALKDEALLREKEAFAKQKAARKLVREEEKRRLKAEKEKQEQEEKEREERLARQSDAMLRFEEELQMRKMSHEERENYQRSKSMDSERHNMEKNDQVPNKSPIFEYRDVFDSDESSDRSVGGFVIDTIPKNAVKNSPFRSMSKSPLAQPNESEKCEADKHSGDEREGNDESDVAFNEKKLDGSESFSPVAAETKDAAVVSEAVGDGVENVSAANVKEESDGEKCFVENEKNVSIEIVEQQKMIETNVNENFRENVIENINEIALENEIENVYKNEIENTHEMIAKENSEENTQENKSENVKEISEENKTENVEENKIENVKENSEENVKENSEENVEHIAPENVIEIVQENSEESVKESLIENVIENSEENVQEIEIENEISTVVESIEILPKLENKFSGEKVAVNINNDDNENADNTSNEKISENPKEIEAKISPENAGKNSPEIDDSEGNRESEKTDEKISPLNADNLMLNTPENKPTVEADDLKSPNTFLESNELDPASMTARGYEASPKNVLKSKGSDERNKRTEKERKVDQNPQISAKEGAAWFLEISLESDVRCDDAIGVRIC